MIVLRLVRCAGCNFIAPESDLYLVIQFEMCSHGPEIMRRRLQRHLDLMRRLGDSLSLVDDGSLLHLTPPSLCTPDLQIIGDIFTTNGKVVPLQIGLYLGLIRRHDLRGGFCRIRVYAVVRRLREPTSRITPPPAAPPPAKITKPAIAMCLV